MNVSTFRQVAQVRELVHECKQKRHWSLRATSGIFGFRYIYSHFLRVPHCCLHRFANAFPSQVMLQLSLHPLPPASVSESPSSQFMVALSHRGDPTISGRSFSCPFMQPINTERVCAANRSPALLMQSLHFMSTASHSLAPVDANTFLLDHPFFSPVMSAAKTILSMGMTRPI